jgi:nucleoside-diphosphate-sugar epimerase
MNILISGSSGFVGKTLSNTLLSTGHTVTPLHRDNFPPTFAPGKYECLIHLAGRAHVMHETKNDIYLAYKEINVDYTHKIALLAKSLGIQRFIFLSSVKVNGELSDSPFNEQNTPAPLDAYGKTKLEAELLLKDFCTKNQIELVIIRPPLIYGPNVKANFKSLIDLCKKPIPLPFGKIDNKRSLISLENLNSFIELCCHHPHAINQTFMISDDQDVSTTELILTIRISLNQRTCLLPISQNFLRWILEGIGKQNLNDRLLGNLQVDISKAKQILGWKPKISFEEGIRRTVKEYVS